MSPVTEVHKIGEGNPALAVILQCRSHRSGWSGLPDHFWLCPTPIPFVLEFLIKRTNFPVGMFKRTTPILVAPACSGIINKGLGLEALF